MSKKPLWSPSPQRMEQANITRFINTINDKYQQQLADYAGLYQWSTANLRQFWAEVWDFVGVKHSAGYTSVVENAEVMREAKWFPGAHLNFAENLLRYRDDETALVFIGEGQSARRMSYRELYAEVSRLAQALRECGVVSGDRVAGFMPNMCETVIAMLAATSIGATWSSCSPDFGIKGVLDRFGQIQPKVLFTANGYYYAGKQHDSLARVASIVEQLPSIEHIIVVPYLEKGELSLSSAIYYGDFVAAYSPQEIEFLQVSFDYPLYIMYSSGTTGLPKCMVQSVGGILLNHLKEHILHVDLKREDNIFYFTTCGWMMWNWLVSALGVGATIVLYDGSPFHPDPLMAWRMAEEQQISIFGTSAKYIAACEKAGVHPCQECSLTALKTILSTGSPLPAEGFEYIYREIKQDVHLASISGGTDLNGCFVGGNPLGPVYSGEIQCRCLGMKIESFGDDAKPVRDKKGELVCTAPFPSMPLHFWDDPEGEKYTKAYFDVYPGIWRHGDYIEITSDTGGIIIYGRSDATLNPGGVRIGTAEIYRQVETFDEITDSIVVGQEWQGDVRVILFIQLAVGTEFNDELVERIKKAIRANATPRHVPAKIIPVADIPYTISMKKVELAVRNVIHGQPVTNKDALRNPEALKLYENIAELRS